MMHHFKLFSGWKSPEEVEQLERVAKDCGAELVCNYSNNDNEPYRGWFTCHNRGTPFDQMVELEVEQRLNEEGITLL